MELDDNSIMPFGKHKGEKMANVPASYLLWLYDDLQKSGVWHPDKEKLKTYIKDNMDVLKQQNKK